MIAAPLSAQIFRIDGRDAPTPHQKQVFDNVDKVESAITLDKTEYLPGEIARITVTIRNPTASALEIPAPFQEGHEGTGNCKILPTMSPRPEMAGHIGGVPHALTEHISWKVPTLTLAPGEAITKTETTLDHTGWKDVDVPRRPGEWWLGYTYDHRMGAFFKVVEPLKATAITALRLRPEEVTSYETRQKFMFTGTVLFLAFQIHPGSYSVIRSLPMRDDMSRQLIPDNPATFFPRIPGFETVGTFDEEVTSLRVALRDDDTVDVTAVTASPREIHLNVPARPAPVQK